MDISEIEHYFHLRRISKRLQPLFDILWLCLELNGTFRGCYAAKLDIESTD